MRLLNDWKLHFGLVLSKCFVVSGKIQSAMKILLWMDHTVQWIICYYVKCKYGKRSLGWPRVVLPQSICINLLFSCDCIHLLYTVIPSGLSCYFNRRSRGMIVYNIMNSSRHKKSKTHVYSSIEHNGNSLFTNEFRYY